MNKRRRVDFNVSYRERFEMISKLNRKKDTIL